MSSGPLLIAYDGSSGARAALAHAAELHPGARALVLTVWRSIAPVAGAGRLALSDEVISVAVQRLDAAARDEALLLATEGAGLASKAGLAAEALERRSESSIWRTIVDAAEELGATAVVVGSRGRFEVAAALLGSTSAGVVHHCPLPVLIARE